MADVVLRRCRTQGQEALTDIAIAAGRIAAVGPTLRLEGSVEFDAGGRLVVPAFVEPHLHLDKVHVAPQLPPNRSGTLSEAIQLSHQSKRSSTVEAVAHRAARVIEQAVLAGTTHIRSHVDVDTIGGLKPLEGVLRAARKHADICSVELVAFPQEGILRDPGTAELMEEAMRSGAGVVGGMPHWELSPEDSRKHVGICLDLARRFDADVDMHVDETDDARSRTLEMLLDATAEAGWAGRVTASHCCAMGAWEQPYRAAVIRRAAELRVNVITNPATNLMLQGREDVEPRRRGLPPVKELHAAGVNVGCGQDCVQDAFYPFGAADPLQVALILCHAAQLTTPPEIEWALDTIGINAAKALRLPAYGMLPGSWADLVVIEADDVREALRTQAARRWVFRKGSLVAETTTARVLHQVQRAEGAPSP